MLILLCLTYGVMGIVAVAWITETLHNSLAIGWTLAYLVAINLVAFAFYVYDKVIAVLLDALAPRVPEPLLAFGLAVPGGWVGALAAMSLANHKTSDDKVGFRLMLLAACMLSITLVAVLLLVIAERPRVSLEQIDAVVEYFVTLVMSAFRAAVEAVRP